MAWSNEGRGKAKRRGGVGRLSMDARLNLLRKGALTERETADFAADAGSQNYIEAERDVNMLLYHPDSIVRYNAIGTVAYEWGRSTEIDRIVDVLLTDEDTHCRRQAAGALGSLFRGKREPKILEPLVRTAKNADETSDVRAFAYTATLDVIGVPRNLQPNPVRLEVGPDELTVLDKFLKTVQ